ncbi:unnamed protein product [Didymodactylos carnosus]|uniref:Uncharacterized protein n=1 Tax=Didymodactylos carnosus TaxID=1234261 RepID=A0A8S2EGF8_9BILA|nr:unnamed protein product [Didymodactylos carnosus]CAF3969479.1 unnamed protein product [Didymodactylos carnosus]
MSVKKGWKDLQKISDPVYFNINRTAKKTLELYNQLVDDDGKIFKHKSNYETRAGLTSEPLFTSDHHFITITHQYINETNWILKIMHHMKAGILTWTVRNKEHQKNIKQAKISILKEIRKKIGLKLDQCNLGSRAAGGTSTTGAQGRKVFSYKIRHLLLTYVPLQHQETLKQLIQHYSIILRAVSSTRSINVSKFKELTLGF